MTWSYAFIIALLGTNEYTLKKNKAIPITGHEGLHSCEMLKIPHCLAIRLTDGGKVFSPVYLLHIIFLLLVLIPARGEPQGLVWPEGLSKLKQFTSSGLEPVTFRRAT
jgi:hypothetical protein